MQIETIPADQAVAIAPAGEPARQQDQPGFEVVAQARQPDARVDAQFTVAEARAPERDVVAEQRPEDRTGHALDQVLAVEEHAVVGRVMAHGQRRCIRNGRRAGSGRGRGFSWGGIFTSEGLDARLGRRNVRRRIAERKQFPKLEFLLPTALSSRSRFV